MECLISVTWLHWITHVYEELSVQSTGDYEYGVYYGYIYGYMMMSRCLSDELLLFNIYYCILFLYIVFVGIVDGLGILGGGVCGG